MARSGSRQAVQQLVEQHYAALYRYAFRLSGSSADAADLTQEAFCKAQDRLSQLRNPDRAKSWLYSILRNAYLHQVRSPGRKQVSLDAIGDVGYVPADSFPDVEPERLQALLDEMPESFRTPLILFYFEDFSYLDIADQLEIPIGTVMSRLARAKAHLRERLSPAAPAEGNRSATNDMP